MYSFLDAFSFAFSVTKIGNIPLINNTVARPTLREMVDLEVHTLPESVGMVELSCTVFVAYLQIVSRTIIFVTPRKCFTPPNYSKISSSSKGGRGRGVRRSAKFYNLDAIFRYLRRIGSFEVVFCC